MLYFNCPCFTNLGHVLKIQSGPYFIIGISAIWLKKQSSILLRNLLTEIIHGKFGKYLICVYLELI